MREVPFYSNKDAPESLKFQWLDAVKTVFDSGIFIGGSVVTSFEDAWKNYLKSQHCLGVGNGYDAIYIALKSLGVGPGDRVAVPSHTFIATWLAVGATGAMPVGIDCDDNGLMDLEELLESQVHFKAVIPVHMHGQMVDMSRLMAWANESEVFVIEDCAQAHGAEISGRKAGTWGHFGAYSFYPTKNLGALGDAGALITQDEKLFSTAKSFANYGSVPGIKYKYSQRGINSRLDPLQAAVLLVNLEFLDSWNMRRREIAQKYIVGLNSIGISLLAQKSNSVFHHFITLSKSRDQSRDFLKRVGVGTEIHYPESAEDSYLQISNQCREAVGERARQLSKSTLSLPMHPWIQDKDIDYVLENLSSPRILSTFLGEI